jgi:ATP phosphoribosyltransferase regulatory subunit
VLGEAERSLRGVPGAETSLSELRSVVSALSAAGLGSRLTVDLGEVRGLDYYTGLVFRMYAPGLGFEVGGGGRYDALLERFGRPMAAVGFMFGLDRLALLLERQGLSPGPDAGRAELVHDADLGAALSRARARREAGVRIRISDGEPR